MQIERELFEWKPFYVKWVAANTLAWVAGWGFARVAVRYWYSLELGAVLILVVSGGVTWAAVNWLVRPVMLAYGKGRLPIMVGEKAVLSMGWYSSSLMLWLYIFVVPVVSSWQDLLMVAITYPMFSQYQFNRYAISNQRFGKTNKKFTIQFIVLMLFFTGFFWFLISSLDEISYRVRPLVHNILLPGAAGLHWLALVGFVTGAIPGIFLVKSLQAIPLEQEEITDEENKIIKRLKIAKFFEILVVLSVVGMIILGGMQPCGWMKELVSPSACQNSFDVGNVERMAFSPDGRLLATASDTISSGENGVSLWMMPYGALVAEYSVGIEYADGLAFSPDGELLAVGGNIVIRSENAKPFIYSEISVWSVDDGSLQYTLDEGNRLAFTHDGQRLVTYNRHEVWVREAQSGEALHSWAVDDLSIDLLAISYAGDMIALGFDHGLVQLWDVVQERMIAAYEYPGYIYKLAFDAEDNLLAIVDYPQISDAVKLYTGVQGQNISIAGGWIWQQDSIQFTRDQEMVWHSSWDSFYMWRVSDGQLIHYIQDIDGSGHGDIDFSIANPDTFGVAILVDDTIQYWLIPPLTLAD